MLSAVVIDCHMAQASARFWAGVIEGYAVRAYDDAEIGRPVPLG